MMGSKLSSRRRGLDGKSLYELFESRARHRLGRRADGLAGACSATSTRTVSEFSTMRRTDHRRLGVPSRR
jgi:hypothetical protein